jgi:lactoylglutathione lyase
MRYLGIGLLLVVIAAWVMTAVNEPAVAEAPASLFSTGRIDIGVVCSNVQKSIDFYTKVVGFTEVEGFDVSADFGGDSGLSQDEAFHVHVLKLIDDKNATSLKLIQFSNKPGKKSDQSFIHSTCGFRYLTIFVSDMAASLERAKAAGAKLVGKSPLQIPNGGYLTLLKDPDDNFVELVGPMK